MLRWQCIVNQFCSTILLHFLFVWTSFFKKKIHILSLCIHGRPMTMSALDLCLVNTWRCRLKKVYYHSSLGQPNLVSISWLNAQWKWHQEETMFAMVRKSCDVLLWVCFEHCGRTVCHVISALMTVFTKNSWKLLPELWSIASRDKPPEKNSSFQKRCVLNLECRILFQEPSDSFILCFNVIFYGK